MLRLTLGAAIFCVILTGCGQGPYIYTKKDIVKITNFELSPDEEKIAFSASNPAGNMDIWVVGIDGNSLKKLTFQGSSLTNLIARYFKRHKWKNFFEVDMISPEWTADGRIVFCQELSKTDMWSRRVVNYMFWTINPDGTDKRSKKDKDKVLQRKPFDPINRAEVLDQSVRHNKKILLKDGYLWVLKEGDTSPIKLIQ